MAFNEDISVFFDTEDFAVTAHYSHEGLSFPDLSVLIDKNVEYIGPDGQIEQNITTITLLSTTETKKGGQFITSGEAFEIKKTLSDNGKTKTLSVVPQ